MSKIKGFITQKNILIVAAVIILLIVGGSINQGFNRLFSKEKITTAYISGKLEDMGTLTTQKLTYSGMYKVTEGEIPLITKKGFSMFYTSHIKAGFDFSDVDIKISNKTVKIKLPKATVQSVKIDPDSIQFYDEKFALFNWSNKEDVTEAVTAAEKDVQTKADYSELLEQANEHAELLLHKLFDDSVGKRTVEISFK